MIWPLFESLRASIPLLPDALFTKPSREKLLAIAQTVRGSVDVFGFECRLAANADRVDLGARLLPEEEAVRGIPGRGNSRRSCRPTRWLRAFTSAPVRFRELISYVYLEYDADGSPRSTSASVFLGRRKSTLNSGRRWNQSELADVKGLLVDLMGQDRVAACEPAVGRCFTELPPGGRVAVIGAMLGRSSGAAHFSVSLPRSRVGPYLDVLGWPHWSPQISAVVKRLSPDSAPVVIDFDVAAEIGPTVGVHFGLEGKRRSRFLCTRLAELGLCAEPKRKAVIAWPRVDTVQLWKGGWPCRFERYLDHIKVTCGEDGLREAKAYLGIAPTLSMLV